MNDGLNDGLSDGLDDGLSADLDHVSLDIIAKQVNDNLELSDAGLYDGLDDGLGDVGGELQLDLPLENRRLLRHAESDSYVEAFSDEEVEHFRRTEDLFDVTGDPDHEKAWRKQHGNDYYPTPQYTVDSFLQAFNEKTGMLTRFVKEQYQGNWFILDPCAGGTTDFKNRVIRQMPYPEGLKKLGIKLGRIATWDIRQDSAASRRGHDFINDPWPYKEFKQKPALIISNPPFIKAREFIDRALDEVEDMGFVVMLLRVNFLGAQKRREWWQQLAHKPYALFIHSERPSFTNEGTDSTEYAHFVFWKNPNVKTTMLEWI